MKTNDVYFAPVSFSPEPFAGYCVIRRHTGDTVTFSLPADNQPDFDNNKLYFLKSAFTIKKKDFEMIYTERATTIKWENA